MTIPVKYRGGFYYQYVYGDSLEKCAVPNMINIVDGIDHYMVYRFTVQKLVGYDANGFEIYGKCDGLESWDES